MPTQSSRTKRPKRISSDELARLRNHPFKYRPRFAVIVECDDEAHHRRVFSELQDMGFGKLRAVSV